MSKFYVSVDNKLEEVGKGNSAYDLAVFNGFVGTEQEWLDSLKGQDADLSDIQTNIDKHTTEIEEIKKKINQAVANTIDTPFITAYWKDSVTKKLYLVEVKNGILTVVEQSDTPSDTLDGLLEDRLLLWHDEFDGTEIDTTKWAVGNCWGASDSRGDDPDNSCYQISDSVLTLSARPSDNTDITQKWYSSAIISKAKLRRGHVQAKIRIVSNKYTNNAYWLNAPDPWPVSGEIDMLETSEISKFEGAIHYGNKNGSNGAKSAGTYPSTTDWFIAGVEIGEDSIKLYVNNEYYKDMCDLSEEFVSSLFAGINPFSEHAKKVIFDIGVTKPTSHVDGDWESTIMIDYVRLYAPESSTSDACNVNEKQEITDFDILIPGNRNVFFEESGIKKIQAHSKFMIDIETTPVTELLGYNFESSDVTIIKPCSTHGTIGFYAMNQGMVDVTFTHSESGVSKTVTYEVSQNMEGKEDCGLHNLGDVNIGESKFWLANVENSNIDKCISNGKFKAEPNTEYTLVVTGGSFSWAYNATFRNIVMDEYDESGGKIVSNAFGSKDGTITTNENTAFVELRSNFKDGKNFAVKDYFDMMVNLSYVNIIKGGSSIETVECTGLSLNETEVTFDGSTKSITLSSIVSPEDCTQEVVWTSQNNFITVEDGVIKGVTLGTDYVTATCGDFSATCKVNITGLYNPTQITQFEWNGENELPNTCTVTSMPIVQIDGINVIQPNATDSTLVVNNISDKPFVYELEFEETATTGAKGWNLSTNIISNGVKGYAFCQSNKLCCPLNKSNGSKQTEMEIGTRYVLKITYDGTNIKEYVNDVLKVDNYTPITTDDNAIRLSINDPGRYNIYRISYKTTE